MSLSRRLPAPVGTPAYLAPRSFNRKGTPRNGPSGRPPATAARAWSYIRWTTALIVGFPASMRARAASSSSLGVTSLFRTSSARPRPSCSAYSAPAAPANLRAPLARAAADGANKFRSFQTGRFHDETKEWDSSLMLPGFRFCRVDIELANLNCWTERMTPLEAEPRALEFKRAVQACYPGLVPGEDVDRASTAVRSKTTWTLPAGRRVRLGQRIRTDGQPASIFIYVE